MGTVMPWEIAYVRLGLRVKDVIDVRYSFYKFSFQKQPSSVASVKSMQQIYRRTTISK